MTPNRTPKTPHEVSPPGILLVGTDSTLVEVIRARMKPIPVTWVEAIEEATDQIALVRPLLIVVSVEGDLRPLEDLAPACGADVVRLEELQDVPRALERLVLTLTRGRSGQYTASAPAAAPADPNYGRPPPTRPALAPLAPATPSATAPPPVQVVPDGGRTSNVELFKDDAVRSVRGWLAGDPDAELVITLTEPGKVLVARDQHGQTVRIEGAMTVTTAGRGTVNFVGDVELDTSGRTRVRGTLVFDLARSVSIKVRGQVHPRTHRAGLGARVVLVF